MRFLAAFVLFASLGSASATTPPGQGFESYVATFSSVDGLSTDSEKLQQLVRKLSDKQIRSGKKAAFVDYLFTKTRQQFLRNFTDYATFTETINTGTYNCLTGTALYALLLSHFEIPYHVIETNYHIFLIAETENGRVLLEATDAENGFVQGESNIDDRIKEYRQSPPLKHDRSKTYYQYEADLYKEVSLDELTGLLYYNRAIVAYNQHDLPGSIENLSRSVERYQSARTSEFASILQITVAGSDLDNDVKRQYLREIQRLRTAAANLSARGN